MMFYQIRLIKTRVDINKKKTEEVCLEEVLINGEPVNGLKGVGFAVVDIVVVDPEVVDFVVDDREGAGLVVDFGQLRPGSSTLAILRISSVF